MNCRNSRHSYPPLFRLVSDSASLSDGHTKNASDNQRSNRKLAFNIPNIINAGT